MKAIDRISVLGAGLMGHAIALEFALAGFPVALYDPDAGRVTDARERARRSAAPLIESGLVGAENLEEALSRLSPTNDLAQACDDADYVAEAAPENLAVKRSLLAEADRLCPMWTIIASNTSSLLPSELGEATGRADRVLVAHYFNPPHLIPVVELVLGRETSADTAERVSDLLRQVGKTPAFVRREIPGFIANRLQGALLREALALVDSGVASVEDVDAVVSLGFGRRLAVFGPFAITDLAGLDVWASIAHTTFGTLDVSDDTPPLLKNQVESGRLGAKSGAGFYDWPSDRLHAALERRDRALLRRLVEDRARERASTG